MRVGKGPRTNTLLHGLRVFRYQELEVRRPEPKVKARGRFGERISKKKSSGPSWRFIPTTL